MTRSACLSLLVTIPFFLGVRAEEVPPLSPDAPLIGIASVNGEAYVKAVRDAGGIPVILPNHEADPVLIAGYLRKLDGLLLPGGADIPPSEYGEEQHETVEVLDDKRFHFEKALGKAWIEKSKKPLLGICLGSQWINVLHGGSLVQDIPSEKGGNHRGTTHEVTLEPGSKLLGIYGDASFEVNSWHHQSVDAVGKGLRVVARGADGVIEATETTDPGRFLIGVQWHPEKMLPTDGRQARLLKAFVEASTSKGE
ncbi:gamma-glutamyl-gamma-aminobutyrate hydrolase family protein [Luteolibacter flavescens]|uniref:Gamma-glutamyl-gamma-aminobutyrate hydrolase family protein n=1 Tax=Luteolibacter flavescens TaxID=1859460 RepID=A0ABT3FIP7_9BACT|nr:gamma-glutamyl-gamma-aminobutyrate hydrolase family protein [Luteolibacter flavescens]MCW1883441.1 gamma-glutamyl-gamma-aminobutyrate hydrolase family protein [Luteolibacter flavescens]